MENLRKEIKKELKILEEMIEMNLEKEKLEKQRKILDNKLKEYLKDI